AAGRAGHARRCAHLGIGAARDAAPPRALEGPRRAEAIDPIALILGDEDVAVGADRYVEWRVQAAGDPRRVPGLAVRRNGAEVRAARRAVAVDRCSDCVHEPAVRVELLQAVVGLVGDIDAPIGPGRDAPRGGEVAPAPDARGTADALRGLSCGADL